MNTVGGYTHPGQWLVSGNAFNMCCGETQSFYIIIKMGHFPCLDFVLESLLLVF